MSFVNKRISGNRIPRPQRTFCIICEGTKTEPNYFQGFKNAIENRDDPTDKMIWKDFVKILGTARNTDSLIDFADRYVKKESISNAHVWCVYDKDDFPVDKFDNCVAQAHAKSSEQSHVTFHVAWSNQCIEYWFLLHFELCDSQISRQDYIEKLKAKIHGGYKKNMSNIWEILLNQGNPKQAIKWAERRASECRNLTPSNSEPCTHVHELVKELAQFISDEQIKNKFI